MPRHDPPPEHRFKPGVSGNPKGRTPGGKNLTTMLRAILNDEVPDGTGLTYSEAIIKKLIEKAAINGNLNAIRDIFDRLEGKPKQEFDHNLTESRKSVADLFTTDEEGDKEPEPPVS